MSLVQKRPHSRSPDHSRRVRQRVSKRADSPEEGEVEETTAEDSSEIPSSAPNRDGVSPKADAATEGMSLAARLDIKPVAKPKVAFPFKTKGHMIKELPKVDLSNGKASTPPRRRSPSPSSASGAPPSDRSKQGDYKRSEGRREYDSGHHSHGHERSRHDSYVPGRDRSPRGERSYHHHGRGSPRGYDDRRRDRTPPPPRRDPHVSSGRNDDGRDDWRRRDHSVRSPDYRGGRGYNSPPKGDFYGRPHSPRRNWSPDRGYNARHPRDDTREDYRLPRRPSPPPERYNSYRPRTPEYRRRSPIRYHDEGRRYDDNRSRDRHPSPSHRPSLLDRISDVAPPRPSTPPGRRPQTPPPRMDTDPPPKKNEDGRRSPPPPVHALPPRPTFSMSHQAHFDSSQPSQLQPHPPVQVPPPAPATYSRPEQPVPPPEVKTDLQSTKSAKASHKVATVRGKEEERLAYGREFVGSGRISEYIMMQKLGEGTFGEVHQARRQDASKSGGGDVALKRIIMHSEKEGMPITALREIKILKALSHPNIVKVLDIVVMPRTPKEAGSVYVVFPYMDHDLAGLLENNSVQLSQSHIKLYMKQLFEGVEYMHDNHIVHRDIKAANILVSNEGVLQIADFGLARPFIKRSKQERISNRLEKYTNCVVTRWYRPPELLMGERYYGPEIDMWGVGCILAEMFLRHPIFQGSSDMDQLEKIWWLCGTPTRESWPDFENLPGLDGIKMFKERPKDLRNFLSRQCPSMTEDTHSLIDALLTPDPSKRPSASQALLHDYFWTSPLPADPKTIPKFDASHELDKRKKAIPAPPPNQHHHQYRGNQNGPPYGFHGGGMRGGMRGRGGPPPHGMGRMHGGHPGHGPGPNGFPPMGIPPPLHMHGPPGSLSYGAPQPGPGPNGLPPPLGFRGPPQQRQQPRHSYGPQNGGPPPPRGPPPPSDSVALRYD